MRRVVAVGAVVLAAAGPPTAADWPCVQRLVPSLTVGSLWPGPAAAGDWRADPAIAGLVAAVADRRTPLEEALARLRAFASAEPDAEKRAEAFAGLVEQSNAGRGAVIERLHGIDRRLRALADAAGRATSELSALPDDAPEAQRDEVMERRKLIIREYESINRTVRFECEIPVDYEKRLGRFAEVLRAP